MGNAALKNTITPEVARPGRSRSRPAPAKPTKIHGRITRPAPSTRPWSEKNYDRQMADWSSASEYDRGGYDCERLRPRPGR